jgi:hypothetical protein
VDRRSGQSYVVVSADLGHTAGSTVEGPDREDRNGHGEDRSTDEQQRGSQPTRPRRGATRCEDPLEDPVSLRRIDERVGIREEWAPGGCKAFE